MAKAAGKLMKVLKKMNSFGKLGRTSSNTSSNSFSSSSSSPSSDRDHNRCSCGIPSLISQSKQEHHAVYVGKSRRQYLISSEVFNHPAFQELAHKPNGSDEISVECEVVLFDHLLWMLDDSSGSSMDQSLDELVPFYTY